MYEKICDLEAPHLIFTLKQSIYRRIDITLLFKNYNYKVYKPSHNINHYIPYNQLYSKIIYFYLPFNLFYWFHRTMECLTVSWKKQARKTSSLFLISFQKDIYVSGKTEVSLVILHILILHSSKFWLRYIQSIFKLNYKVKYMFKMFHHYLFKKN